MPKSSSSNHDNNRVVESSQRKRLRSSSPMEEEATRSHSTVSQSKMKKVSGRNSKEKKANSNVNDGDHVTTMSSLPSGSSISMSSCSNSVKSKISNKAARGESARMTGTKENENPLKRGVNNPISMKKSKERPSEETGQQTRSANASLNGNSVRSVASHTKPVSLSMNNHERPLNRISHSSQRLNDSNLSSSSGYASSFAASNHFDGNQSTSSIDPLIESSLEYRELRRMYLHERTQAQEWRKDYGVAKKQLEKLKATTIPRPTAEVLEWIQELLYLINDKNTFIGDGRDLKKIGDDLALDPASLATVVARTPQKTSLKIFRLLYPTIASRAACVSISKINPTQLKNIYLYTRNLHKNLNFSVDDMRKAIGTSIRTARRDLTRQRIYLQQRANDIDDQDNQDREDSHQYIIDTGSQKTTLKSKSCFNDEAEVDEAEVDESDQTDEETDNDESENQEDDEKSADNRVMSESENDDVSMNKFQIDEELDQDSD